jgi:hypothetical protein
LISTLLDKTLELFGRSFLVAAFVPTVIAVVVLNVVVHGRSEVAANLERWSKADLGEVLLDLATWLLVVYLVAYVVYGARSVLRAVFQGMWPRPLGVVQAVAERAALRRFRRAWQRLDGLTDRKNDVDWVMDEPTEWPRLFHPNPPSGSDLDKAIERARTKSGQAQRSLRRRWTPLRHRRVVAALTIGRAVYGAAEGAADQQRASIMALTPDYEALRSCRLFDETRRRAGAWIERARAQVDARIAADYPPDEPDVRATIFGNVMGRLTAYSQTRYGIPLDVLWPRLLHVLPGPARRRVDDATVLIDFSVISAAASLVVATGSVATAYLVDGSGGRALVTAGAGVVAYAVFVRVAITAARSFSEEVEACVDLYRRDLLGALGLDAPSDIAGERAVWHRAYILLSRGELVVPAGSSAVPTVGSMPGNPWTVAAARMLRRLCELVGRPSSDRRSRSLSEQRRGDDAVHAENGAVSRRHAT